MNDPVEAMNGEVISYLQSADPRIPGMVVFNRAPRPANGRLDSVGSRVAATGFTFSSAHVGELRVIVQCQLLAAGNILFDLAFFNERKRLIRRYSTIKPSIPASTT